MTAEMAAAMSDPAGLDGCGARRLLEVPRFTCRGPGIGKASAWVYIWECARLACSLHRIFAGENRAILGRPVANPNAARASEG